MYMYTFTKKKSLFMAWLFLKIKYNRPYGQ